MKMQRGVKKSSKSRSNTKNKSIIISSIIGVLVIGLFSILIFDSYFINQSSSDLNNLQGELGSLKGDGGIGALWRANYKNLGPLYLGSPLSKHIETLVESDLPIVLSDGTFTDDNGNNYNYEQSIFIGTSDKNNLVLNNSEFLFKLSDDPLYQIYSLVIDFANSVDFTSSSSEGERIRLFNKEYTIGTQTDSNSLVLLGGASENTLNVGETVTVYVNNNNYEVSLNSISASDTSSEAIISINGITNTFIEGQTKKIDGINVFARTIFRTGDNQGYVILIIGSDILTLKDGYAVYRGSDNNDIEGTSVSLVGGINNLNKIIINVSSENPNTLNYILEGESFFDPVFGTISIDFIDLIKTDPINESYADIYITEILGGEDNGLCGNISINDVMNIGGKIVVNLTYDNAYPSSFKISNHEGYLIFTSVTCFNDNNQCLFYTSGDYPVPQNDSEKFFIEAIGGYSAFCPNGVSSNTFELNPSLFCVDSDGGISYAKKGNIRNINQNLSDFCTDNNSTLIEYYCGNNGIILNKTYQAGLNKCINGQLVLPSSNGILIEEDIGDLIYSNIQNDDECDLSGSLFPNVNNDNCELWRVDYTYSPSPDSLISANVEIHENNITNEQFLSYLQNISKQGLYEGIDIETFNDYSVAIFTIEKDKKTFIVWYNKNKIILISLNAEIATNDIELLTQKYLGKYNSEFNSNGIQDIFGIPETIGSYIIHKRFNNDVDFEGGCDTFTGNEPDNTLNLSGEVCFQDVSARYNDTLSNKSVEVNLIKITSGKDLYKQLIDALPSEPFRIGSIDVHKVEGEHLYWFGDDSKNFNLVVITESIIEGDENGLYFFQANITADNPITLYFLNKYPPEGSNNQCIDSDGGIISTVYGEVYFEVNSLDTNTTIFNLTFNDSCVEVGYSELRVINESGQYWYEVGNCSNPVPQINASIGECSISSSQEVASCNGKDCYVQERFCKEITGGFFDADADEFIKCSNGCSTGACIPPNTPQPPTNNNNNNDGTSSGSRTSVFVSSNPLRDIINQTTNGTSTSGSDNKPLIKGFEASLEEDPEPSGRYIIGVAGGVVRTPLEALSELNKIYVKISTGEKKEIKLLPSDSILKAKLISEVDSIKIEEYNGEAVYTITGKKKAWLLFIIPMNAEVIQKINTETGEIMQTKKPWWSFLALGI